MFNFSEVKEESNFELLPKGVYSVVVQNAEWKEAKSGGEYLNVMFKIFEGKYENRTLFHMFNLINSNNEAVNIAMQQIVKLVEANGKKKETMKSLSKNDIQSMLLDMTADVYVKIQKGTNGYDDQNRIVNFKATKSEQASLIDDSDEIPF